MPRPRAVLLQVKCHSQSLLQAVEGGRSHPGGVEEDFLAILLADKAKPAVINDADDSSSVQVQYPPAGLSYQLLIVRALGAPNRGTQRGLVLAMSVGGQCAWLP